jgi:hypothetical protein
MPSGQFEERRLLERIDRCQIGVGFAVVRVEGDGPAEGSLGGLPLAALAEGDAEIVLGVGLSGLSWAAWLSRSKACS